jgi:outer membrane protein OmpA-like peptidoglycan-associated protein
MTNGFATRFARAAGAAVLACLVATSASAEGPRQTAVPNTIALFFDNESASLTPEAKMIVLGAVAAAERAHADRITLAAYSASDESARDPKLAERRAEAVKRQIAAYGFKGLIVVDEEAPELPLVALGDDTFERSALLRLSG